MAAHEEKGDSRENVEHNKSEAYVEDKNLKPYPTRTLDPPYSIVDQAKEIEKAGQQIKGHVHSKLDVIAQQIKNLQNEAESIITEAERDMQLHKVPCSFEKRIGEEIYLYEKPDGSQYFSKLSPADWGGSPLNHFIGAYRMKSDRSFEDITEASDQEESKTQEQEKEVNDH